MNSNTQNEDVCDGMVYCLGTSIDTQYIRNLCIEYLWYIILTQVSSYCSWAFEVILPSHKYTNVFLVAAE